MPVMPLCPTPRRPKQRRPRGYLLLEAMVGGSVLAIALVAIASMTTQVVKFRTIAAARSDAASLVNQRIEQAVAIGEADLSGGLFPVETIVLNGRTFTLTTTAVAGTEAFVGANANWTITATVDYVVEGAAKTVAADVVVVED